MKEFKALKCCAVPCWPVPGPGPFGQLTGAKMPNAVVAEAVKIAWSQGNSRRLLVSFPFRTIKLIYIYYFLLYSPSSSFCCMQLIKLSLWPFGVLLQFVCYYFLFCPLIGHSKREIYI